MVLLTEIAPRGLRVCIMALRDKYAIEAGGRRLNASDMLLTTEQMSLLLQSLPASEREQITDLWLYCNVMTRLPKEVFSLFRAEAAVVLFFFNNQLETLPHELGRMCNLAWLYAENNQLRSLPSSMSKLTTLCNLRLAGNPALPERFRINAAVPTVSRALALEIGLHYGRVERCRERCVRACVAVLGVRSKSALWKSYVPKDVARIIARMLMESQEDSRWDTERYMPNDW